MEPYEKLDAYVRNIFRDIPNSPRREELIQEIVENLADKVRDLTVSGKSPEDAVNKAIVDFGDMEDVKSELREELPSAAPQKERRPGLALGYSLCGTALIVGLLIFINFYYTPKTIWFVYPTFGVLWWPLSMFFRWRRYVK